MSQQNAELIFCCYAYRGSFYDAHKTCNLMAFRKPKHRETERRTEDSRHELEDTNAQSGEWGGER